MALTPIPCSFAGIPFKLATAEVRDFVERYHILDRFEIANPAPISRTSQAFSPIVPPAPKPRLGELFWPVGMSRCATYYGIADYASTQAMIAASFGSGYKQQTFVIGSMTIPQMTILPPRPLSQLAGAFGNAGTPFAGLYLIVLVDQRYQFRKTIIGNNTVSASAAQTCSTLTTSSTWSALEALLEIPTASPAAFAAPSSAYGTPEPDSPLYGFSDGPSMADAIAHNVGGFWNYYYETGQAFFQTWNAALGATTGGRQAASLRIAGGNIFNQSNNIFDAARGAILPTSIVVTFPIWVTNYDYWQPEGYRDFYKNDASYGAVWQELVVPSSLGAPYSNIVTTGLTPFLKQLNTTAKATVPYGYTLGGSAPTNHTTITALAQQLAKDFYDRESACLDEIYGGIIAWPENAGHDIIWHLDSDTCYTHIRRLPYDSGCQEEYQHGFGVTAPTSAICSLLLALPGYVSGSTNVPIIDVNGICRLTQTNSCVGSGSGSGGGSGGGGNQQLGSCCASVPNTLYVTASNGDNFTITYAGAGNWTGNSTISGTYTLSCSSTTLHFGSATQTSYTCSSFSAVFVIASVTYTITP